jgi:outer membrane lipoprotein SlyB
MQTTSPGAARPRQHPLLLLAALAVVLFCLVGSAAILGWIPSSIGGNTRNQLSEAERATLAASLPSGEQGSALPAASAYPTQQLARLDMPAGGNHFAQAAQADSAPSRPTQVAASEPAWCGNCGNVESVRTITQRAQGSGLGAAGGAVIGGLLGNQIGGGTGRQLATVAGAVGGAVVGNQVEGNMKATTSYEIRVRLDDGKVRTFRQSSAPQWRSGDRVRIVKGSLRRA